MTYQEALRYLNSFVNYERLDAYDYRKSFKLDRMRRLVGLLDNPQEDIRSIHIAGTKGKGSTAAFVHSILKAANYKVGLYTSPHLVSFRERIRIDDELISEADICEFLEKVRYAIDKMGEDKPSFFEIYTAMAYLYFKYKRVDFAVYETGLGGRLDATNIIEPLVCAITPISYEHTQRLGSTLREIATEKAGIIKEGAICVSAPQDREALAVIEDVCKKKNAKLMLIGRDILYEELRADDKREIFSVLGASREYPILETRLLGSHQVVNAATAVGIVEALILKGLNLSSDAVRLGIENARWPGRLEVVRRRPFMILDGAQNRASANALAQAIKKIFKYKKLILILGVSKDKDIKGILAEILPMTDLIILTKSGVMERALEPSNIKELIDSDRDVVLTSNVGEALKKASSRAAQEDLVLVTGSLFIVGEAKESLV